MEIIINTALLYTSAFLSVSAVVYPRSKADFHLPKEYATWQEDQAVRHLLLSCSENTICYLNTRLQIRYCLVFLAERVVILGPYRATHTDFPAQAFSDPEKRQKCYEYYDSLPAISSSDIKLAAGLLFVSLYGSGFSSVEEQEINLQIYSKGEIPAVKESPPRVSRYAQPARRDEMIYYIAQVRSGNYRNALASFRRTMQPRTGNSFALIRAIEGLSSLRTQTYIALMLAGVPEASTDVLFLQFRNKGRIITNMKDAVELGEGMIARACSLVRQSRSEAHSEPIRAALEYIHRNLNQPITVERLAAEAKISPNRLTTRFHEEVGIPPVRYIQKQRLRTAAELLVYTNLSIQHICTSIGILDGAYFTRCFRREYGMAPTQFRQRGILDETWSDDPNAPRGQNDEMIVLSK